MKNMLFILSIIILLTFVFFHYAFRRIDLRELIQNGNEEIMEYCEEYGLIPKFGLVGIREYDRGYILEYFVYTDKNKIHAIELYTDNRARIREVSNMIDDQSTFLETLP